MSAVADRSALRTELARRVRDAVSEVRKLVSELDEVGFTIEVDRHDGSRAEMARHLDEIEAVLDRAEVVS